MRKVPVPTGPEHIFFDEGEMSPDQPQVSPHVHFRDGVTAEELAGAIVRITTNGRQVHDSAGGAFLTDRPINFDVMFDEGRGGKLSVWEFDPTSAVDVDGRIGYIAVTYFSPDETPDYGNEWAQKLATGLDAALNPQTS